MAFASVYSIWSPFAWSTAQKMCLVIEEYLKLSVLLGIHNENINIRTRNGVEGICSGVFGRFSCLFFNFVLVYVWSFLTCAVWIVLRLIVFTLWYLSDKYFDTTDQFELFFKHIFVSKHPNNAKKFCFQMQEITFAVQMDFLFQINTVDVLNHIHLSLYNLIQDKMHQFDFYLCVIIPCFSLSTLIIAVMWSRSDSCSLCVAAICWFMQVLQVNQWIH